MTSISHSQPPRVVVLSVVVAAFVTIASQVLVTRLLSALIFYHFSFWRSVLPYSGPEQEVCIPP